MALVQEITEKYFLAAGGTKHTSYAEAYKASVEFLLEKTIMKCRINNGSSASSNLIARDILREFVVTLPR